MSSEPTPLTKIDLLEITHKWQQKLNITSNRIQITKMKNKWSSCSTKSNITLNSELTKLPKELVEYAILHELLHLIAPNHGKTFKALLSVYMPNWEEMHNRLVTLNSSGNANARS
jgi:predicted metal-dependent hydrolase